MTLALSYGLTGAALLALGLYGLVAHVHVLRRVLSLNVGGSGVFLVLVALARRDPVADPVPHAMVLTGIVVTVAATAVALALARRIARDAMRKNDDQEPPA